MKLLFKTYLIPFLKSTGLILILLFSTQMLVAQGDSTEQVLSPRVTYLKTEIKEVDFKKEEWKKAIRGIDYSGEKPTEKKKKKEEETEIDIDDDDDERIYEEFEENDNGVNELWSFFFKFILIVGGAIGIGLIIANMIGLGGFKPRPSNRKFKTTSTVISLEKVEDHIHESDLESMIQQMLSEQNYVQAVRLYYLAIIKELSINKWIRWKKDKTNRDYIRELQNTNLEKSFRGVTGMFERVWYGSQEMSALDFQNNIEPTFQAMLNNAKKAKQ